jgi:cobalamin biosynthesis Mg chelatase CobN
MKTYTEDEYLKAVELARYFRGKIDVVYTLHGSFREKCMELIHLERKLKKDGVVLYENIYR